MTATFPTRRLSAVLVSLAVLFTSVQIAAAPSAAAAERTRIIIGVNSPDARPTELVFIRGRVLTASGPAAGARVRIQAKAPGGSFRTIGYRRAGERGGYLFPYRVNGTRVYRAAVVRTKRYDFSVTNGVRVRKVTTNRTYDSRRRAVSGILGAQTTAPRSERRFGQRVIHGAHRKGVLAKVGRNTSLVYGRIFTEYQRRNGVRGQLGAPISDMTCQLLEGACLQRFQNGSIYFNPKAPRPVSVVAGRGPRTSFMAAAISQQGYREPSFRGSKYNAWQGSKRAWCAFYLAWASAASGNGNAFPRGDIFSAQLAEVRRRGGTFSRPQRGAVAFIGSGSEPTHAALVLSVRPDGRIVTIEGNVGQRSYTGHPRGVFRRVRTTGSVKFYWNPTY